MSRYANRTLAPPSANRGELHPPSSPRAVCAIESRIDLVDYLGPQPELHNRLRGTKMKQDTGTATEHTTLAQMTMMIPP